MPSVPPCRTSGSGGLMTTITFLGEQQDIINPDAAVSAARQTTEPVNKVSATTNSRRHGSGHPMRSIPAPGILYPVEGTSGPHAQPPSYVGQGWTAHGGPSQDPRAFL